MARALPPLLDPRCGLPPNMIRGRKEAIRKNASLDFLRLCWLGQGSKEAGAQGETMNASELTLIAGTYHR